jgi:hypothetical protein
MTLAPYHFASYSRCTMHFYRYVFLPGFFDYDSILVFYAERTVGLAQQLGTAQCCPRGLRSQDTSV